MPLVGHGLGILGLEEPPDVLPVLEVVLRLWGRGPSPPSRTPISARLGGGEGLWPTLLGTLEAHLGASDPLRGGRV